MTTIARNPAVTAMDEASERLAAKENAAASRWKPIEEGLPKWGGWFLGTRAGVAHAALFYYDGRGGWFDSPISQLPSDRKKVIAYMPLPEPYQPKENR